MLRLSLSCLISFSFRGIFRHRVIKLLHKNLMLRWPCGCMYGFVCPGSKCFFQSYLHFLISFKISVIDGDRKLGFQILEYEIINAQTLEPVPSSGKIFSSIKTIYSSYLDSTSLAPDSI